MHLFLKQCYDRSSIDTIWWDLYLMLAEDGLKTSLRYNQIVSIEDRGKQGFKNKYTLVINFNMESVRQ